MKSFYASLLSLSLLLTFPAFSVDTPNNSSVPKKEEKVAEKKEEKAAENSKVSFLVKAVACGWAVWCAATATASSGLKADKVENKNSK